MRGSFVGTASAAAASDSGYTFGLSPYVSYVSHPFSPMKIPPPPSPRGRGISGATNGVRPPSYQVSVTGGMLPRAANSYCVVIASGYEPGSDAGEPHGVEVDTMDVGKSRSSAQKG